MQSTKLCNTSWHHQHPPHCTGVECLSTEVTTCYDDLIKDPTKDMLLPCIFAIDKTHCDSSSCLQMEPLTISLGIFKHDPSWHEGQWSTKILPHTVPRYWPPVTEAQWTRPPPNHVQERHFLHCSHERTWVPWMFVGVSDFYAHHTFQTYLLRAPFQKIRTTL